MKKYPYRCRLSIDIPQKQKDQLQELATRYNMSLSALIKKELTKLIITELFLTERINKEKDQPH